MHQYRRANSARWLAVIIVLSCVSGHRPARADPADILGMTLGEPISDIKATLKAKFAVKPSPISYRYSTGMTVMIEGLDARNKADALTETIGVLPTNISNKAWFIGRSTAFSGDSRPSMTGLKAQLIAKYGAPSMVMSDSNSSVSPTRLYWFTTRTGTRIPAGSPDAGTYLENCTTSRDVPVVDIENSGLDVYGPGSFSGQCPVVVQASFNSATDNANLADHLDVSLINSSLEVDDLALADRAKKEKNNEAAEKAAGVKTAL